MAAVTAVVLGLCGQGDHVVATKQLFSITVRAVRDALPRFGIDVTIVDGTDADAIAAACASRPTQLLFVETPANPPLSLVDLDAVAAIKGPIKVVDSTFATPVLQRPLDHGVDLVLHSATKGLGGHNDALLGVIAGERELIDAVWALARGDGRAGVAVRRLERHPRHPHAAGARAPAVRHRAAARRASSKRTTRWRRCRTRGSSRTRSTSWPGGR